MRGGAGSARCDEAVDEGPVGRGTEREDEQVVHCGCGLQRPFGVAREPEVPGAAREPEHHQIVLAADALGCAPQRFGTEAPDTEALGRRRIPRGAGDRSAAAAALAHVPTRHPVPAYTAGHGMPYQ